MKNRTSIILFLLLVVLSCKSKAPNELKVEQESLELYSNKDSLLSQLLGSIRNEDESLYTKFLNEWNQKLQPNDIDFIKQNEAVESVYAIFKSFYKPKHINKLGSWQKNYDRKQGYYVIQNRIAFSIADSPVDTINNFRPVVDLEQTSVLYSSSIHSEVYNEYLRSLGKKDTINLMQEVHPNAPLSADDLQIKKIEKFFLVHLSSDFENWSIISDPYVTLITFNKSINKAKVHFTLGHEGGEAIFEKRNEKWILLNSKSSWIE